MAMDPAAISANPASTTTWGELTAPERPAARAKGTVRPSDMPITMSRTNAVEAKCVSTCCGEVGGAGVGSESIAIPEVYLSVALGSLLWRDGVRGLGLWYPTSREKRA